jgi:transcriptional regulator GlxA family with amidase domain
MIFIALPTRGARSSRRDELAQFHAPFPKQATDDSPLAYSQKLRIAGARRLLENNRCTMQEISDAVG